MVRRGGCVCTGIYFLIDTHNILIELADLDNNTCLVSLGGV